VDELPVRNIADVHLADLFDLPGCPVCAGRARATDLYVEGWLWESVNDVASRSELDASRGLCPSHVDALVATDRRGSGSMVGSAILLDAMLRVRREELARIGSGGRRRRARTGALAKAAASPECPVCEHALSAEAAAVDGFLAHVDEPAWTSALGDAPFCLGHLVGLMRAARASAGWEAVEVAQLARVTEMHEGLCRFLQHSSYDTRHLRTPEEVASIEEVVHLLGSRTRVPRESPRRTPGGEER
jgi:hypothetical protein